MTKHERAFIATVREYYAAHGRHQLPWRQTTDPYRILVSEVMLQQTQVDRVVPKYEAFIEKYPTVPDLAKAPLKEVLQMWQGLGYNRRAQLLQRAAQYINRDLHGQFPSTYEAWQVLPGIGPYTAGAIMAFAYNQPLPIIETNIRTVYLHHFFLTQTAVSDAEVFEKITATLDAANPRQWYGALMDYGVYLKRVHGNQNKRSTTYQAQTTFIGSDRQIRGAVIRLLAGSATALSQSQLSAQLIEYAPDRVVEQLLKLEAEGLVQRYRAKYRLPT